MRTRNRSIGAHAHAGFSLIEILAVIVIIGILMVVLLPRLLGASTTAKEQLTLSQLQQIAGAIDEYEHRFGDFPPSAWPDKWGTAPNPTNVGAECLVQSLWSNEWGGTTLNDTDAFCNTDDDQGKKPLGKLPTPALFELKDQWGNPIAYLHRRDYLKQHPYVTTDSETGEFVESNLGAALNPQTKAPYHPQKFQLLSAGADGRFGTPDDLGNWPREARD